MQKEALTLKPSIVNAVIPMLVRNAVIALVIVGIPAVIYFSLANEIISRTTFILGAIIIAVLIIGIPLIIKIITLSNITYRFFKTHVISDFRFIVIKKHTVQYNKITNISTNISLWDRLSNAGDITLHTAEDKSPDFILQYLENPEKVERTLHRLMHK